MKGSQVQWIVGSSLCLASIPALAFANTAQPLVRRLPEQGSSSNKAGFTPHIFLPHPQRSTSSTEAQVVTRYRLPRKQAQVPAAKSTTGTLMDGEPALLARWNTHRSWAKPKAKLRYITVQSGDTLWGISRRYKVPLSSLEQWNHLSVDSPLQIGSTVQFFPPPANLTQTLAAQLPFSAPVRVRTNSKSSQSSAPKTLPSRSKSAINAVTSGVFGMQVVQYAERFVGVPYHWGGESPTTGFDCSGFAQFVLGHFGISIGRSSYQQFQVGAVVYQSDLRPGDLVFFDTDGPGASHVGIYVGNQRFISAAGSAITMNSLTQSYWASHYLGARRLGPS